jgi:hypothetical protein
METNMNAENPYDAVLEDHVTGYGEEAVDDRVTEYGILVAQAPSGKKSEKGKDQPKLKTATKLFITQAGDPENLKFANAYANQVLKGAEIRSANSWDELSAVLREYQSIEQVVLMFHGSPGSLTIGGVNKSLDKVGNLFPAPNPKIKQIDFEACSVGEGADELVPFARIFGASTVRAWSYFHYFITTKVSIPEKMDSQGLNSLRDQLAKYSGYFLPGTPSVDALAKKPGTYDLVAEWFRIDLNTDPLPPAPGPGDQDQRGKTFKRRSDAKPRRTSSDKVKELRKLYESPTRPFEQVIIEISG